jgi:hypothetical protein
MQVGLLTPEQKQTIEGKEFCKDSFFNPVLDKKNNWVISIQEIEQAKQEFEFLKNIPLIELESQE